MRTNIFVIGVEVGVVESYSGGKRVNDKNANLLSRLQHSFASALISKTYLPAYVIIFLDDDLID